jgi:hypothetical protein
VLPALSFVSELCDSPDAQSARSVVCDFVASLFCVRYFW